MVHHLTPKKAHIDGSISFQNISFQKYWQFVILSTMGMSDMPYHTQDKLHDQIGLEYFQLHLKNLIFHSHVVFIDSQRWCII